jgi:hypothetical protein
MKPWAIGDLIIGDEWQSSEGTWYSLLRDSLGLPRVNVLQGVRYGAWPVFAGLDRPGRTLTLETRFMAADAIRDLDRVQLFKALNPEDEDPVQLLAVDDILPGIGDSNLLAAFGPWDLRFDGTTWTVRDLFDQIDATLVGAWVIAPGEGLDLDAGTDECSLTGTDVAGTNAIEVIYKPTENYAHAADRYLYDDGTVSLHFDAIDDKWELTDGVTTIQSAAQTFAADALQHVIARFGVAGAGELKLTVNGTETTGVGNAVALGDPINMGSEATPSLWARGELMAFRFYDDLTSVQAGYLYTAFAAAADDPIGNARHVDVIAQDVAPLADGGRRTMHLVSTLVIDGDVRWRSRDGDYWHWDITGTPDSETVTAVTEDKAFPILYIKPNTTKAAGQIYKSWVAVVWKADAASTYPVKLGTMDTLALAGAAKMQADCDDLRVYNGTTEIDRWIQDPNTATTDIWVNLDFEGEQSVLLGTAIAGAGAITEIVANGDISGFPGEGLLWIDAEAFSYIGKNDANQTFLNVTRSVRGTAAAAHTTADTVYWLQHDIWVYYGDATLAAPTVDDDYKPIFELDTSTNDSWVYQEFGETSKARAGGWTASATRVGGSALSKAETYTANQYTNATPWEETGTYVEINTADTEVSCEAKWTLYNLCGITNANYTNGEYYYANNPATLSEIQSSLDGIAWTQEYDITHGVSGAWTAWSQNQAIDAGSKYVRLYLYVSKTTGAAVYFHRVEAADVTLTLDTTYTPDCTIGAEQTNYPMDCTIANAATGDTIQLTLNATLADVIEVDTDLKTIKNLTEGSSVYGALTLVGGVRRDWLPLLNGANILTYTETGVVDNDIDLVWDRRYYE